AATRFPVAAALLAFAALIAAPAAAHGPIRKKLRTDPPPGTVVPPTPPLAHDVEPPTSGATASTTGTRPLRVLAAEATAVVLADVAQSEMLDDGRLAVYHLHVQRVLAGRHDEPAPRVVEIRGASRRPPLLTRGEHAVLLLRPAPALSYLAE